MFRVFRGLLVLTMFLGGIAVDVYIWHRFHINYVNIFNLNPRYGAGA